MLCIGHPCLVPERRGPSNSLAKKSQHADSYANLFRGPSLRVFKTNASGRGAIQGWPSPEASAARDPLLSMEPRLGENQVREGRAEDRFSLSMTSHQNDLNSSSQTMVFHRLERGSRLDEATAARLPPCNDQSS